MLNSITHEVVAEELLKEEHLRSQYGRPLAVTQLPRPTTKQKDKQIKERFIFNKGNSKDIFGNDKVSDNSVYFVCTNCNRNIAGSRFANHINRCLGGRNTTKERISD